jgi:Dolichyl-phosphate-mannose-protein mannosyltransferase
MRRHLVTCRASTTICAVVGLLTAHGLMLAWIGLRNSPGVDEAPHLVSGLSHWHFGRFDLYRVNPPLVRSLAAVPLVFFDVRIDWTAYSVWPYSRPEFKLGARFCELNQASCFWYVTLARWMCIPFSVLGGIVVFRWATELYGSPAGLLATTLWCVSPNVLGNAAMITPDAAAASTGVTALYFYHRWLKRPTWPRAILSGLGLGVAELTKTTWIMLFALLPALWIVWRLVDRRRLARNALSVAPLRPASVWGLVSACLFAVYVINLGYGFEGSFTLLKQFAFVSCTLGGPKAHDVPGNRFADSWLGRIPVPLPANYVSGVDIQRYDFEIGKASYLGGVHKERGWWYWYFYALAVKVPLGTWLLAVMAIVAAARFRRPNADWRDELIVLAPAAAVLLLVSSQTGFSRYLRYALPMAPFCLIFVGQAARFLTARRKAAAAITAFAAILCITSSLAAFPHSLSYFNELAGGPLHGPEHLLDANVDWGQDLLYLKRWCDTNPGARPLQLQYFGVTQKAPQIAGIEARPMPRMQGGDASESVLFEPSLEPGWYAISVNDLYGYRHSGDEEPCFVYLGARAVAARAGYSIRIYHLSAADIEHLRSRASRDHE